MAALRVVIVGGGVGGLSAAVALQAVGVEVALYEQAHRLDEVGAGVVLFPNSQRVLERLGLAQQVGHVAARLTSLRFYRPDGTIVSALAYGDARATRPFGLHRADLVTVLAASLADGVIHVGYRCVEFAQHDGSTAVSFDNGACVEADVVIGADGIHSALRHYVVVSSEPVFSGTVAYRGLIPATRLRVRPRGFVNWGGQGKHLLIYPVRGGELVNFVGFVPADEPIDESWSAPGDPATLAAEFADWDPEVGRFLSEVDSTFKWPLYDRDPLPQWTRGRLTLLGDAAHPMLPHMGQGANQAIEDAMGLATFLRGATAVDAPQALIHYQRLRRRRTARIQRGARANGLRLDRAQRVTLGRHWVQDYDVEADALAERRWLESLPHTPGCGFPKTSA